MAPGDAVVLMGATYPEQITRWQRVTAFAGKPRLAAAHATGDNRDVSMPARTIRLRRPPQLIRVDGRYVPPVSLAEVDRVWASLRAANPRYFDGPILHVLGMSRNGHGGVVLHVAETSYRFYAVQRPGLAEGFDCGIRPLGAKAICRWRAPMEGSGVSGATGSGERRDRYLMARRSSAVAYYPNEWEFAPGGGLEPDDDPAGCLLRELAEETDYEAVSPPIAVALLYDPGALSWEVVHTLDVRPSSHADATHAWEHAERNLVADGDWPEPLAAVARTMIDLIPRPSPRPR